MPLLFKKQIATHFFPVKVLQCDHASSQCISVAMFRIGILAVVVVALLRSSYSQSGFMSSPPDGRPVCKAGCILTYRELEESILCKDGNIERLHGAFFRTNRQRSTVVTVTYWLDHCSDSDFEQDCDNITQRSYTFRSSRSSVHNVIQPELLERLSLYTYDGSGETVKLSLYIKPFCVNESVGESVGELSCQSNINQNTNNPIALSLLNKVTTWVSAYSVRAEGNSQLTSCWLSYIKSLW